MTRPTPTPTIPTPTEDQHPTHHPKARRAVRKPTVSRTHRYAIDQADLDELIARRARLITAVRAAHPGAAETRLTRLEDGTCTDVWRWDSAERMRAALVDMPRFGAQAGAAWSQTRDATHVDVEIVDER